MNLLKKSAAVLVLVATASCLMTPAALAEGGQKGKISGRSVAAGVLSFLVWPGIGQAVNDNSGKKVVTHAVLGLLPPYRFWSGYDALVDRQGGYWEGRI